MPKLINKTRFTRFANDLWDKIKRKYDVAFKEATISASDSADKKITLTRVSGATVDVNLQDYARLQDRNEFKKDVSVDDVSVIDTLKLGALNGDVNEGRASGHRNITTKSFVDGYVNHMLVYTASTLAVGTPTSWEIWAVKKGATREADRVFKKYTKTANVQEKEFNGTTEKYVKIEIGEKFANEVYFIARCGNNRAIKACNVKVENRSDVVNISSVPGGENSQIDWGTNADNNIAIMYLYGRESIGSLAEKLKQTQADGSNYVLKSETTAQGGQANAGKVAKLDQAGKLNANMLPAIAINEFISVSATAWDEGALNGKEYQNGDVIFHEATQKRYLCVDRTKDFNNGRFVELNSKDGVVSTVNDKTGAVVLNLEATENLLKLKIGNGSGTDVEKSVDIISDAEIEAIINGLN